MSERDEGKEKSHLGKNGRLTELLWAVRQCMLWFQCNIKTWGENIILIGLRELEDEDGNGNLSVFISQQEGRIVGALA